MGSGRAPYTVCYTVMCGAGVADNRTAPQVFFEKCCDCCAHANPTHGLWAITSTAVAALCKELWWVGSASPTLHATGVVVPAVLMIFPLCLCYCMNASCRGAMEREGGILFSQLWNLLETAGGLLGKIRGLIQPSSSYGLIREKVVALWTEPCYTVLYFPWTMLLLYVVSTCSPVQCKNSCCSFLPCPPKRSRRFCCHQLHGVYT